jgi:hypothetical protein
MFIKKLSAGSILLTLLLTSCDTTPRLQADWKNGAKRGWIVQFYTPNSSNSTLPDCLQDLSKADFATRQFVKIEYWHVRQMRIVVAELPNGLQGKVNDQIEIWPEECLRGKIPQISKILTPVSQ